MTAYPRPVTDWQIVAAVEHCLHMDQLTQIDIRSEVFERGSMAGTYVTYARGRDLHAYGRPMIQLFDDGVGSAFIGHPKPSCPDCDNWAYTARCQRHPELPLDQPLGNPAP